jgi:hypothetical protein
VVTASPTPSAENATNPSPKPDEREKDERKTEAASSSGVQISTPLLPVPLSPLPAAILVPREAPKSPEVTEPEESLELGEATTAPTRASGVADDAAEAGTAKKPSDALPIDPAILPDPAIVDSADVPAEEVEVADEPWTAERTIALLTERALIHGSAVYEVLAVARCETGYTFMPWRENGYLRRGSLGEVGVGQWLPPVERNHWGRTPHWREHQYHILAGYVQGDPAAIWWDADALAWSMGPAAPAGFRSGWSCWRIRGPWWFQ